MRVTNIDTHNQNINSILTLQESIKRAQISISQQTRLIYPSDDPIATSHIRTIESYISKVESFNSNIVDTTNQLGFVESALEGVSSIIVKITELQQQSKVSTLQQDDKKVIALEIEQLLDEMLSLANTQNSDGTYLFSGYQSNKMPYVDVNSIISYQGDDGHRQAEIGFNNFINISYSGIQLFEGFLSTDVSSSAPLENIFNTIQNLIATLRQPTTTDAEKTAYFNEMTAISQNLDLGFNKVLSAITKVGSSLNSLENQSSINDEIILQNTEMLSSIRDLDPADAISNLAMQMTTLQAAYLSFTKVNELSLVNYL